MIPFPSIYSAEEVRVRQVERTRFYLEPYIPAQGVVLVYGKFGTYKTPITFNMAVALARGEPLWGMNVAKAGPVLYLEADTPEEVILDRMQAILKAHEGESLDLDIAFQFPGVNIVAGSRGVGSPKDKAFYNELFQTHRKRGYKVVFIDALRGVHTLDDKESDTPHQVYEAATGLFPGATIVMVHHDRKSQPEETEDMRTESFSGSQAWINHATVGLKITHHNRERSEVSLHHSKSQASELRETLVLRVEDGALVQAVEEVTWNAVKGVLKMIPQATSGEQDEEIAKILKCSTKTAKRRRVEYLESLGVEIRTGPKKKEPCPNPNLL